MEMLNKKTGKNVTFKPVVALSIDGMGSVPAMPKEFSTGSIGYYATGKTTDADGNSYQVSCNITLIGSKPDNGEGGDKS